MDLTLQEALAQLEGYTSDEIAELMRLAGKKGFIQSSTSCPMANYLFDVLGEECAVGRYTVFSPAEEIHYTMPHGVQTFTALFDNGVYSDLDKVYDKDKE